MFHAVNRHTAVRSNARRFAASVGCAWAIAVVSSTTTCARSARLGTLPDKTSLRLSAYRALRAASSSAGGSAPATPPPAPITETNVSCEAPVKQTTDITHVWGTLNPAATDKTPNDTAYTAVATPIDSAFLKMGSFDMIEALSRDIAGRWLRIASD